jgi:hypothetical protein
MEGRFGTFRSAVDTIIYSYAKLNLSYVYDDLYSYTKHHMHYTVFRQITQKAIVELKGLIF